MFSDTWIETGLSVTFDGKREDYFPDLMKWASENGASVEGFEMVNFKEEGFGLRATRDIKVSFDRLVRGPSACLDCATGQTQVVERGVWAGSDLRGDRQRAINTPLPAVASLG